jgi:poly(3-hydroxybutyrate) depolymerase
MLLSVRRSFCLVLPVLFVGSLWAQDAGLALSTSVGYNTQRLSLPLSPEQAKEAERLGQQATAATRDGKYGDALNFYAQGQAVMHNVEWTPDAELASALRGKVDHAMISPGKVTVSLAPLYPTAHAAAAKLSASIFLVPVGKEGMSVAPAVSIDPAKLPFTEQITVPDSATGNYNVEVRLTEANGAAPTGLNGVFVKMLPIHVEALSVDAQRLRDSIAKVGRKDNPALATAQYTLALYEMADKGEVNPRTYNFRTEFATAQMIVDAIQAGKDPFAGKQGDFRKAYLSNVDKTLQPYRLFIPAGYDGTKATPMVVALHGMGGDENSMFDSYGKELTKDAQGHGFIVVAPKGRAPASMYRGSAEQDVLDVMAEVERDYKVDKSRVYLMGHSMGGYGTWSIAIAHPELFAALGPISGGGDTAGMVKIKDIPQYVTHGDNDKTVNVNMSRSMVEAGKKAGAQITYVEVPGGSHVSVAQPAFAPMLDFFAKQSKAPTMSAK